MDYQNVPNCFWHKPYGLRNPEDHDSREHFRVVFWAFGLIKSIGDIQNDGTTSVQPSGMYVRISRPLAATVFKDALSTQANEKGYRAASRGGHTSWPKGDLVKLSVSWDFSNLSCFTLVLSLSSTFSINSQHAFQHFFHFCPTSLGQ